MTISIELLPAQARTGAAPGSTKIVQRSGDSDLRKYLLQPNRSRAANSDPSPQTRRAKPDARKMDEFLFIFRALFTICSDR